MSRNFNKTAEDFFTSSAGSKLADKKDDLQKLADSSDGKKVKAMLDQNGGFSAAIENGDMESIKNAVSKIMQTEAGARLAKQLSDMIK